jgi:hypothetical protein
VRLTIVFKTGRKPLTGELLRETDQAYEMRFTDRDAKFRFVTVQKAEVREVRPVLGGLG